MAPFSYGGYSQRFELCRLLTFAHVHVPVVAGRLTRDPEMNKISFAAESPGGRDERSRDSAQNEGRMNR